jgi:dTDP-4-dehydrorhamnose 3,5-epimerase
VLIRETSLAGVFLIDIEAHRDHRGWFARTFCEREFAEHGLRMRIVQGSISSNRKRGTVRGMHFLWPPSAEAKLVRCFRGRMFDVVIDLRPHSATYMQHFAAELDQASQRALYIPPGFAHGFQSLEDDTDVLYQMSDYFQASLYTGVRWNDAAFGIKWPISEVIILDRDGSYPDFDPQRFASEYAARAQLDERARRDQRAVSPRTDGRRLHAAR